MKHKVYFVPCYIPQLKYYARLIPYLENRYDIGFLLIKKKGRALQEMVEHCKNNNFNFYVIDAGLNRDGSRVPFITPIKKMLSHRKSCRQFIAKEKPTKLIFEKTSNPHSIIAREANKAGVETIRLQSAFQGAWNESMYGQRETIPFFMQVYYQILKLIYAAFFMLDGFSYASVTHSVVTPDKLGVVDELSRERILRVFNPKPTQTEIVGTLDVEEAHLLKNKITSDKLLEESLKEKYGFQRYKKTILVLSARFHYFYQNGKPLPTEYQIQYYENVFSDIWSVFSSDEINLVFKLHPKEENIYEMFKKQEVIVCDGATRTDELVCLSDLCVNNPSTTTNYYILGSDMSAIFVNFSGIEGFDLAAKDFNIKHISKDRQDFVRLLRDFKNDSLEKQYDNNHIALDSVKKIVSLIG